MDKWFLTKIPKKAYFYWGSPMLSWLRFLTIKTFQKFNPDWEIYFYYPKKVYTGGPVWNQGFAEQVTGKNYFDNIKDIPNVKSIELDFDSINIGYIPDVFRSDILRLKLLGIDGGAWFDMDIVFFRPLNEMCFNAPGNQNIDTVVSYNNAPGRKHFSIGFLMACSHNPFYNYLYQHSTVAKNRQGEYQHLGITLWHKHFANTESIRQAFPNLTVQDIEMWNCYYLSSFDVPRIIGENVPLSDPRTIALHHYCGHPRMVEWESKLTPENYTQFNNTLCTTIRRALT